VDPVFAAALNDAGHRLGVAPWEVIACPPGNVDRHPDAPRHHALLRLHDGGFRKILGGQNLAVVHQAATQFHQAYPDHSPGPGHLVSGPPLDTLWQEAIEATSLEHLLKSIDSLPAALVAWDSVRRQQADIKTLSTLDAWSREWNQWVERFLSITAWSASEQAALRHEILPALQARLSDAAASPQTRCSNGDFTTHNVLVPTSGPPWIIDAEYTLETHFHFEDRVRAAALSETLRQHPGLAELLLGRPSGAEALFYNLRQLWLEHLVNGPDYLARVSPARREVILHADTATAQFLPGESPVQGETEVIQLFHPSPPWTEARSVRSGYLRGRRQMLAFALPPDTTHLRLDPASSRRDVTLHALRTVTDQGTVHDHLARITVINATRQPNPDTCRLRVHNHDPQLLFATPPAAAWLMVELEVEAG